MADIRLPASLPKSFWLTGFAAGMVEWGRYLILPPMSLFLPFKNALDALGRLFLSLRGHFRAKMTLFRAGGLPPFRPGCSLQRPGWSTDGAGCSMDSRGKTPALAGCTGNAGGEAPDGAGCPRNHAGCSPIFRNEHPAAWREHPRTQTTHPGRRRENPGSRSGRCEDKEKMRSGERPSAARCISPSPGKASRIFTGSPLLRVLPS
jgi:hypothetical protein